MGLDTANKGKPAAAAAGKSGSAGGSKAAGGKSADGKAAGGAAKAEGAEKAGAGARGRAGDKARADDHAQGAKRLDRMAVRAKLAVSEPGDAVEREADAVADKVMRMPDSHAGAGASAKANPAAAAAAKPAAPAVQQNGRSDIEGNRPTVPGDFAQQLGEGTPLDPQTRSFFEQRLGQDLGQVRIHADAKSDAACRQIQARAFTYGNHIAFASGHFQPQSEAGKRLLAHELAHVLQQSEDKVPRMVMRDGPAPSASAAPSGAPSGSGSNDFEVTRARLEVPPIKSRHLNAYRALASAGLLRRPLGYDSRTRGTAQMSRWLEGATADVSRIPAAQRPSGGSGWNLTLNLAGGANTKTITAADEASLTRLLKVPTWNAAGTDTQYQVDHAVEFQLGGADAIENLELLNQEHNGSIGSSFSHGIKRTVREEIRARPSNPALAGYSGPLNGSNEPTPEGVMATKAIVFRNVEGRARESARREGGSSFWSLQQINAMDHVLPMLRGPGPLRGESDRFALLSPTGNLVVGQFAHGIGQTRIDVPANQSGGMAGFLSRRIVLSSGYNTVADGGSVGTLEGRLDFGPKVTIPPEDMSVPILQARRDTYSGKLGTPASAAMPNVVDFTPMSPLELSDVTFGTSVFGRAILHPSHPALSGLNIPAQIRNGRLGLFYSVDASSLAQRLRIPGVTIDSASIDFGYDGQDFSVGGGAEFTIRNFGTGHLNASVDTAGQFQLEGGFRADTRLFDRADMRLWYRSEGGFGGTGTLAITTPNKIRGIRSASVTATYEDGVFSATGTVAPNLPGVQSAGLSVRYGPDASGATSLLISGDLAVQEVPGIRDGTVHVEVEQANDVWRVRANGQAHPNLPGVTSAISITYDDGVFDGQLDVDYARGIFSGHVMVGLTNRAVNAEGELTAGAAGGGDEQLKVYGSGNINARLTEHLQGGVGVKVKPNGTLLISGRLGIPADVELFGQYPAAPNDRRELFRMPTVSIPLVGFAVGGNTVGIALTINGRVTGFAHVGPGRLTQAEINIVDFNPAQPESLHITGGATFNLPAEAGIEASLDAGVSLGAAVVRATAGINVTAAAVLQAAVTPHVEVDWTPGTGLHLHANLNASLTPRLRFGLNGYAEVVADAFVTSFTLWRKDWNLAQREIGANLALGINVPVDYYSEGGRGVVFDPNQVSFTVPSLNGDTFRQLLNSEGGSERVERPPS